MKYSLKFKYYNGEQECPPKIPGHFWTCEKYVSEHAKDEQARWEAKFDADLEHGRFKNKMDGDWPNPLYFIDAFGCDASIDEKFTAYCIRRVDDFSSARAYDTYFDGL